ncbi:hypothetical protein P154DRAFT_599809 [Amniculicola lignicola CBS 123094]|uniref:Uncharacterized protein n=1 Tax=Amniculicola lignicola CBS 123094 TaxID=1392246 RepID=A0A6A5WGL7_9PLEO|nr:hypothetical protein P154DRAFT_599809 [Amniculicola lignicola CBS 123094]
MESGMGGASTKVPGEYPKFNFSKSGNTSMPKQVPPTTPSAGGPEGTKQAVSKTSAVAPHPAVVPAVAPAVVPSAAPAVVPSAAPSSSPDKPTYNIERSLVATSPNKSHGQIPPPQHLKIQQAVSSGAPQLYSPTKRTAEKWAEAVEGASQRVKTQQAAARGPPVLYSPTRDTAEIWGDSTPELRAQRMKAAEHFLSKYPWLYDGSSSDDEICGDSDPEPQVPPAMTSYSVPVNQSQIQLGPHAEQAIAPSTRENLFQTHLATAQPAALNTPSMGRQYPLPIRGGPPKTQPSSSQPVIFFASPPHGQPKATPVPDFFKFGGSGPYTMMQAKMEYLASEEALKNLEEIMLCVDEWSNLDRFQKRSLKADYSTVRDLHRNIGTALVKGIANPAQIEAESKEKQWLMAELSAKMVDLKAKHGVAWASEENKAQSPYNAQADNATASQEEVETLRKDFETMQMLKNTEMAKLKEQKDRCMNGMNKCSLRPCCCSDGITKGTNTLLENQTLQARIDILQAELDTLQAKHDVQIRNHEHREKMLSNTIKAKEEHIKADSAAVEKTKQLRAETETFRKAKKNAEYEVARLQTQVRDLQGQIADQDIVIQTKNNSIDDLEANNVLLEQDSDSWKKAYEEEETVVIELRDQIATLESELEDAKANLTQESNPSQNAPLTVTNVTADDRHRGRDQDHKRTVVVSLRSETNNLIKETSGQAQELDAVQGEIELVSVALVEATEPKVKEKEPGSKEAENGEDSKANDTDPLVPAPRATQTVLPMGAPNTEVFPVQKQPGLNRATSVKAGKAGKGGNGEKTYADAATKGARRRY